MGLLSQHLCIPTPTNSQISLAFLPLAFQGQNEECCPHFILHLLTHTNRRVMPVGCLICHSHYLQSSFMHLFLIVSLSILSDSATTLYSFSYWFDITIFKQHLCSTHSFPPNHVGFYETQIFNNLFPSIFFMRYAISIFIIIII